ncbi:hypothetical protein ACFL3I_06275 [Pseudomonadota bacterium]
MHPSLLFSVLRDRHPELEQYGDRLGHRYADLMFRAISPGLFRHELAGEHPVPDDAIALGCRYLEREFGRGRFRQVNEIAACFGSLNGWHMRRGLARPYWLSAEGHEVIDATRTAIREGQESYLANKNGGRLRRKRNAVYTSRDIAGHEAVTNARFSSLVPLNMEAIDQAVDVGIAHIFPDLSPAKARRADRQLCALQTIGLSSHFGRGVIKQTYKESNAGRLCGHGTLSLQNVKREVRYIALAGSHEYDLSTCHFQFMAHYARQYDIPAPWIIEYANDSTEFRRRAGERVGISPSKVKTALLAILNGAPRGRSYRNSMPGIIGVNNIDRFYADPVLNELTLEATEIGDRMRQEATIAEDGTIENCRGKSHNGSNGQRLSHLLQGLESEVLHLIIEQYGDRILIVQHDGWTMSEYVNPREIEELIERELGMRMPVQHRQL